MKNLMHRLKSPATVLFLAVLMTFAAWKGLETLAIVSLILALSVVYRRRVASFADASLRLLQLTRTAKLGELELSLEKQILDLSVMTGAQHIWAQVLLAQLEPEQLGLLLAIVDDPKFAPADATKENLRALRNRGLISHNEPSLHLSTQVTPTALGAKLAQYVAQLQGTRPGQGQ